MSHVSKIILHHVTDFSTQKCDEIFSNRDRFLSNHSNQRCLTNQSEVFHKIQVLTWISVFIPHLTHRLRFTLSDYFACLKWKLPFLQGNFCSQSRVKLIFQSKEFSPKPSINFLANFPNTHTYTGPIILINDNHLVWKTFFCARKVKFCMFSNTD